MPGPPDSEILNIEQAAALLGVSVKTFNKVLHSEALPARKIGREWKFSRSALIAWLGLGSSRDYYKEGLNEDETDVLDPQPSAGVNGTHPGAPRKAADTRPARAGDSRQRPLESGADAERRTSGWSIQERLD